MDLICSIKTWRGTYINRANFLTLTIQTTYSKSQLRFDIPSIPDSLTPIWHYILNSEDFYLLTTHFGWLCCQTRSQYSLISCLSYSGYTPNHFPIIYSSFSQVVFKPLLQTEKWPFSSDSFQNVCTWFPFNLGQWEGEMVFEPWHDSKEYESFLDLVAF